MKLSEKIVNDIILINRTNQTKIFDLFKDDKCPEAIKELLLKVVAIWIWSECEEIKDNFCRDWLSPMELPEELPEMTLDEFIQSSESLIKKKFPDKYKWKITDILNETKAAIENHKKPSTLFSNPGEDVSADRLSCASTPTL